MTNEELFDDLKQFIAAQNSQLEEQLRADMATKEDLQRLEQSMATKEDLKEVEKSIHQVVGDAMAQVNEENDARLGDHERRITRLEHRSA